MSEQQKKMSMALSGKECYVKGKPNSQIFLKWIIHNQSKAKWEKEIYLKNVCNDDATIRPYKVRDDDRMTPDRMCELVIGIHIPLNTENKNKIVVAFQFENGKYEKFGEQLIGIIDLREDSNLNISSLNESIIPEEIMNESMGQ